MRKMIYKPLFALLLSSVFLGSPVVSMQTVHAQTVSGGDAVSSGDAEGQETAGEAEQERTIETTSSMQDENGITYEWYGYDDGTAEIYEIGCTGNNLVIDIPSELAGYVVTSLTGSVKDKNIASLTIPETVTWLGEDVFADNIIQNLYYNATHADNDRDFFFCPFSYSEIYNVTFGDTVEVIEDYTFYQTAFHQEELALQVPYIGTYAFHSATFQNLRLTNDVKQIGELAFDQAEIACLYYDCPDVTYVNVDDMISAPFYMATIQKLEFFDTVTAIPDYCFANAHFKMKEYTIDQERVGIMAFYNVWDSTGFTVGTDMVEKLTITEDVKFIGQEAFAQNWIKELVWNADVETDAYNAVTGIFYMADIFGITVGEQVEKLPDYCFANASLNFSEFTISTPQIGKECFNNAWVTDGFDNNSVKLTLTDDVKNIGAMAFERCLITDLYYETNADNGATDTTTGPFYMAEICRLHMGEQVTEIKPYLFANTEFTESFDFTVDIPVGDYAFFTALSRYNGFVNLTIGENVPAMGKGSFHYRDIENLTYNAVSAKNANAMTNEAAFFGCEIGNLTIGDTVELLDAGTFCGIKITQEEFVIPDSVKECSCTVKKQATENKR